MEDKKLSQRDVQHLYWRAGFGLPLNKVHLHSWNLNQELDYIFSARKQFEKITAVTESSVDYPIQMDMKGIADDKKKKLKKENRTKEADVALDFFYLMLDPQKVLREKMSLFWLNHFACRFAVVTICESFLNTIRQNALGDFKNLLFAVLKHPGMLTYLNAKQNRKEKPNENLARELMELFTLGRGNYSEQDIKEAARALTGWSFRKDLAFEFRGDFHDEGYKTIFSQTGKFKGDDVLNMILERKECAYFITKKICKEFINENVSEGIIRILAVSFYESGYDISKLLREIFCANVFWEERNIGSRIKSPFELIAGIAQITQLKFMSLAPFIGVQRMLGQELFRPLNVAGWPGGKSWIDNSTIISRTTLPYIFFEKYRTKIVTKELYDTALAEPSDLSRELNSQYSADWSLLNYTFNQYKENALAKKLMAFLIQSNIALVNTNLLKQPKYEINKVRGYVIQIMSLPEYQLC